MFDVGSKCNSCHSLLPPCLLQIVELVEAAEKLLATIHLVMSEPAFWPPVAGKQRDTSSAAVNSSGTANSAVGRDGSSAEPNSSAAGTAGGATGSGNPTEGNTRNGFGSWALFSSRPSTVGISCLSFVPFTWMIGVFVSPWASRQAFCER